MVSWFGKGSRFYLKENIHFCVIVAIVPLVEGLWVDKGKGYSLGQDQGMWTFLSG